MAFVRRQEIAKDSQVFVQKLKDGVFVKDHLINHGTTFKGGHEEIALSSFKRYISSASYAMMKKRRGQYVGESYRGY